jgi:pyridoxal phosphate enzyme (YggS family)
MDHKDLANEVIEEARAREIADGVHGVLDHIAAAEAAAGRDHGSVRLLAATKTRDVGEILAAIDAGVRMIGENRPQEVTAKSPGLARLLAGRGYSLGSAGGGAAGAGAGAGNADGVGAAGSGVAGAADKAGAARITDGVGVADVAGVAGSGVVGGIAAGGIAGTSVSAGSGSAVTADVGTSVQTHIPFHLIGQLQANKIGKVLPVVDTIESVDSIDLAEKIARRATMRGITIGVLLEVNESGEASKSGCAPGRAIDLAQRIGAMGGLELQGLMTIGAHVDDERTIRKGFAHLRRTRDQILASGAEGVGNCKELSMGMTQDMAYAIEEGSTIVRVGTAIFGARAFI